MISVAFKEWASVVRALEEGKQDILFRKGGIAEEGRAFRSSTIAFFSFRRTSTNSSRACAPSFATLLEQAMAARPPDGRLVITSWVRVTRSFAIETRGRPRALERRHVYAPHVLLDRLHGRHGKTLYALEVAVHRLEKPPTFRSRRLRRMQELGGPRPRAPHLNRPGVWHYWVSSSLPDRWIGASVRPLNV